MNLARQRAIQLNQQKETLRQEFEDWRKRTEEGQPPEQRHMEKHYTQIRRITAQLEGFLEDITIADGKAAAFDANEPALARILGAYRMWDYFRGKFALRDVAWLRDDLICADELAWECYRPARERAAAAKVLDTEKLKEPPLVFFSSQAATPFAQARNTPYDPQGITDRDVTDFGLTVLKLPIPVIGVPWFQINHLPAAVAIGHEVGHAVERDFGLEQTVHDLIDGLSIDPVRKGAWLAWRHELFADVYGALATGPASVLALMDYLIGDLTEIRQEQLTEKGWGSYPTRFLRMELNFELLDQLGLSKQIQEALKALAVALGITVSDPVQEWRNTYEHHLMDKFEKDLPAIVKALKDGPYPAFGGTGLTEVIAFQEADLLAARDRAFDVIMGNVLPAGDPLRRLFAAATLAYYVDPLAYAQKNGQQALIKRMRAAIPKGVRSAAGKLTGEQLNQQEALDRQLGHNLLKEMFSTRKETTTMSPLKTATEIFDELKATPKQVIIGGVTHYIIEGDLFLDETELFAYATRQAALAVAKSSGLDPQREGLIGITDDSGRVVRWRKGLVLTYTVVKSSFADAQYPMVVKAMHQATAAWEATCGVNFQHLSALDDGSPAGTEVPIFRVDCYDSGGEYIAVAFFPYDPPSERVVYVDPSFFADDLGFNPVGVLRHELGHVLGFRHEHIRSGAPAVCPGESLANTIALTDYNPTSVMHYFCGGVGSKELEITEVDRQGARLVYGPPDREVTYCE